MRYQRTIWNGRQGSCGAATFGGATAGVIYSVAWFFALGCPIVCFGDDVAFKPLSVRTAGGKSLFQRLDGAAIGLNFRNSLRDRDYPYYLVNGAGVCVGDYDGDGWPDVYLVSQDGPNRLFRQVQPWKFEDVTDRAGVEGGQAWGTGAAFVDVNNDGRLDLYVCNTESKNLLYVNQGDGAFRESGAEFGLDHSGATTMAAFADYDRDGDLDVYLLKNRTERAFEEVPHLKAQMQDGQIILPPAYREHYFMFNGRLCEAGQRDLLLRNEGGGRFVDVTDRAGIDDYGMGLSATWWDYNNDGWLDLYIGNDLKSPDAFYHNNGDGTFKDVVSQRVPHTTWFSMGADFADIDNDGLFDFLIADMSNTTHFKQKIMMGEMGKSAWFLTSAVPRQYSRNALYLNTGTDRFMEVAYLAGLANTDWTWSVRFADMDNDGWQDVFVTNGVAVALNHSDWSVKYEELKQQGRVAEAKDLIYQLPDMPEQKLAYRNTGDLRFQDVSALWGLNHEGVSHGAVFADLDRDGDLDLLVNNFREAAGIYRNEGGRGHAALFELRGLRSNFFGIGAKLSVETAAGTLVRQLISGRGYMSADEPVVHVGLGDATNIRRLIVEWPSGAVQELADLAADRLYTLREPDQPADTKRVDKPKPVPQFVDSAKDMGLLFKHSERQYDDFAREPLLPNKLSQLGPGLAWGDFDADGDDDLFIGGAAGQAAALFRNLGRGRFERVAAVPWTNDAEYEDLGAVWLDADCDGDLDLYVVSGGVECEPGDPILQDRLYINGGDGSLTRAKDALPTDALSGSVATAGDLDKDGDLDLFIGSRVIPGRYPLTPGSRLLRNEGGTFLDVTDQVAPALRKAGLVTSAIWSDADDDGWLDLLVSLEWGPVRYFHNTAGRLEDRTATAGFEREYGWWNGIAAADVNGDGAMDYVATNFGLNTKYFATKDEPARLYVDDFDKNGQLDMVETTCEHGKVFPVRGRSCSSAAMPFIREKFPTFSDFAAATAEEIYGRTSLETAQQFRVNQLQSGVWLNGGKREFLFHALPATAQASPGFGVAATDFDGDALVDLCLAQNFFSPQPETGHMDGGLGLYLRGEGGGRFRPIRADSSGLIIPQDAKALTTCDLDGDGWADLTVSTNDGPLRVYRNSGATNRFPLAIRLRGTAGNPTAVGARVTVVAQDGKQQTSEVEAGGGYLSQSAPTLFFGLGSSKTAREVLVRWPDGVKSVHSDVSGPTAIFSHP